MALPKRSPVLGYNHNVRYRGLVFHVQTEDSGAATPHIFTHLFYSGVIINTRKHVYEAAATEESVKTLMQAQHKATLRELKANVFDDKIDQYLADTPGLLPRGAPEDAGGSPSDSGTFGAVDSRPSLTATAKAAAQPPPPTTGQLAHATPRASTAPVVVARAGTGETLAAAAATAKHAAVGRTPTEEPPRSVTGAFRAAAAAEADLTNIAAPTGYAVHRGRSMVSPEMGDPGAKTAAPTAIPAIPTVPTAAASATSPRLKRNTDPRTGAEIRGAVARQGVIVNAPAHVVGGGGKPAAAQAVAASPAKAQAPSHREQTIVDPPVDTGFARDIISEKSLDEVILAYLIEGK